MVHIASGVAGLMSTIVIGNRKAKGKERFEPNNALLTFFGSGLLWVGWYGFNAGSAMAAVIIFFDRCLTVSESYCTFIFYQNTAAGIALLNTQLASAMAALTWMGTEWIIRKRPTILGLLSGAIAGLVAITPAAGYVDPTGAFFIGFLSGPFCYYGAQFKHRLGFDDALDAFGIHSIGGIFGGIMIGFFSTNQWDADVRPGIFYGGGGLQLGRQLYGITVTIAWAGLISYLLLFIIDKFFVLRNTDEDAMGGDINYSLHGEPIDTGGVNASLHGDYYDGRIQPNFSIFQTEGGENLLMRDGEFDVSILGDDYFDETTAFDSEYHFSEEPGFQSRVHRNMSTDDLDASMHGM